MATTNEVPAKNLDFRIIYSPFRCLYEKVKRHFGSVYPPKYLHEPCFNASVIHSSHYLQYPQWRVH